MADFTALGSALYTVLDTASTVPVYQALAPQGGTPPYCIFERETGRDEYTFTSTTVVTDYIVKVISSKIWPGEAQTIYGQIHDGFNDAALTVTGYTALRCRRGTTFEYQDNERFWHVGGVYRVEAHK